MASNFNLTLESALGIGVPPSENDNNFANLLKDLKLPPNPSPSEQPDNVAGSSSSFKRMLKHSDKTRNKKKKDGILDQKAKKAPSPSAPATFAENPFMIFSRHPVKRDAGDKTEPIEPGTDDKIETSEPGPDPDEDDGISEPETPPLAEELKKFNAKLPTDLDLYFELFKCKDCERTVTPGPGHAIYCTKGHVYCVQCREDGGRCGWAQNPKDIPERVCGRRTDFMARDPFVPRIFQLLSFPCPNASSTGCQAMVSGQLLLEGGPDDVFNCGH